MNRHVKIIARFLHVSPVLRTVLGLGNDTIVRSEIRKIHI